MSVHCNISTKIMLYLKHSYSNESKITSVGRVNISNITSQMVHRIQGHSQISTSGQHLNKCNIGLSNSGFSFLDIA